MPRLLTLTAEDVARAVVGLARHPRRRLVIPWWMAGATFLDAHFKGLSDIVQTRALKSYHERV